jgi:hypothetical protein
MNALQLFGLVFWSSVALQILAVIWEYWDKYKEAMHD